MLGYAPLSGAPLGVPPGTGSLLNAVLSERFAVGDGNAVNWTANAVFNETIQILGTAFLGLFQYNPVPVDMDDGVKIASFLDAVKAQQIFLVDYLAMSDRTLSIYVAVVVETLRIVENYLPTTYYSTQLQDTIQTLEKLHLALPVALTDAINATEIAQVQTSIRVLEAIRLASVLQGAAQYNITVTQLVRLSDALTRFFGADITDGIVLVEVLMSIALAKAQVAENLVVAEAVVPQLILSVRTLEKIRIHPTDVVNMLFNPTLLEGVVMDAGYIGPDGSFSTWSMNMRNGAVSEYSNYNFNSFAQVGGRYIAASDTGLYELLGDDDDGTDIIARLRGGYMQFGGTQLSRLKEAYISARGEGSMVLRIVTADGTVYNYSVDTRNMRSTKVHMGKGQRSRYFAFELISDGQDFDLDSLEFVPIVVQRRV